MHYYISSGILQKRQVGFLMYSTINAITSFCKNTPIKRDDGKMSWKGDWNDFFHGEYYFARPLKLKCRTFESFFNIVSFLFLRKLQYRKKNRKFSKVYCTLYFKNIAIKRMMEKISFITPFFNIAMKKNRWRRTVQKIAREKDAEKVFYI